MILPNACFPLWKSSKNLQILDRDLTVRAQNINLSMPQSSVALWTNLILLSGLSQWLCEACGWLSIRWTESPESGNVVVLQTNECSCITLRTSEISMILVGFTVFMKEELQGKLTGDKSSFCPMRLDNCLTPDLLFSFFLFFFFFLRFRIQQV